MNPTKTSLSPSVDKYNTVITSKPLIRNAPPLHTSDKKKTGWFELTTRKDEFLKILQLLVEFDEKTGRYKNFSDQQSHFLRKSVSVANIASLRIFFQAIGFYVYEVVVEMKSIGSYSATQWIHEDGIRAERDEYKDILSHPVHTITCLTDFYENNSSLLPSDLSDGPSPIIDGSHPLCNILSGFKI